MRCCWEPFLCVNKEISPGCFFPGLVVPGAVGSRRGGLGHKQAKLKSRFHVFLKVSLSFFFFGTPFRSTHAANTSLQVGLVDEGEFLVLCWEVVNGTSMLVCGTSIYLISF